MITQSAESQKSQTPASALQSLKEGNARFAQGESSQRDLPQQVQATSGGQWPFAVVLSCIDSRVAPEIVFDQGIGDIFSTRVAGNFVTEEILGCMEFGCKVAGSKLVVVLGHSHCGAIKGACDQVELGNLTKLIERLQPAVAKTVEPTDSSQRNSKNAEFVQAAALNNVRLTVANILEQSPVLAEMHKAGEIDIVGAMYDVETGKVDFLA